MHLASLLAAAANSAATPTPEALEAAGVLIALDATGQPDEAATTAFAALDLPTRRCYQIGQSFRHGGIDYRLERPTVALRTIIRCPKTWAIIPRETAEEWEALGSVETARGPVPWTVLISFAGVAMLPLPPGDAEDLRFTISTTPQHPKLRALIAAWGRSLDSDRARAAEELRRPEVPREVVRVLGGAYATNRRHKTIVDMLCDCFTGDNLIGYMRFWNEDIARALPGREASLLTIANALADTLDRHGARNDALALLATKNPNRAAEILAWKK